MTEIDGTLLIWGGNRAGSVSRCAAVVSGDFDALEPDWEWKPLGKPQGNIRLACARSFGGVGYGMMHFRADAMLVELLKRETKSILKKLKVACDRTGDDQPFRMKVVKADPLESDAEPRAQSIDFHVKSEGDDLAAIQVASAVADCHLNIVQHDVILRPSPGQLGDGVPSTYQYYKCFVDFTARENKSFHPDELTEKLRNRNFDPDRFPLTYSTPPIQYSLDPDYLGIDMTDFHEGPFLSCTLVGKDEDGMMSLLYRFLRNFQGKWQRRESNTERSNDNARHGIIRGSARSMGGVGVIQACIAIPSAWRLLDEGELKKIVHEHIESREPKLRNLLKRKEWRLDYGRTNFSPWHYRTTRRPAAGRTTCEDSPGELARVLDSYRKQADTPVDIVELDVRQQLQIRDVIDITPDKFSAVVTCGVLVDGAEDIETTKGNIAAQIEAKPGSQHLWLEARV